MEGSVILLPTEKKVWWNGITFLIEMLAPITPQSTPDFLGEVGVKLALRLIHHTSADSTVYSCIATDR